MASTSHRIHGSGRSLLYFGSTNGTVTPIVSTQGFTEEPPQLLGQHEFIQPLDWPVPSEVMTAEAMNGGIFQTNLLETWSEHAFNRLGAGFAPFRGVARGGAGAACDTILDLVRAISQSPHSLFLTKVVATPDTSSERLGGARPKRRATIYMNCKIIQVQDGDENVEAATLQAVKQVRFAYTHRLYDYRDPQRQGFDPAGRPQALPAATGTALGGRPALGVPI